MAMVLILIASAAGCGSGGGDFASGTEGGPGGAPSAAGGDGDGASGGKGRFLEQGIFFPERVSSVEAIGMREDGVLLAIGYDESAQRYCALISDDSGGSWDSALIEGGLSSDARCAAISRDGTGVLLDASGNYVAIKFEGNPSDGGDEPADSSPSMDGGGLSPGGARNDVEFAIGGDGGSDGGEVGGSGEDGGSGGSGEDGSGGSDGGAFSCSVSTGSILLPSAFGGKNGVSCAAYAGDGTLLVLDLDGEICRVDALSGKLISAERLKTDIQEPVEYFMTAGSHVLAVTGAGVRQMDASSGKAEDDGALREATEGMDLRSAQDGAYPIAFAEGGEEDSVVFACHEGLFYHQDGGSVCEQLLGGDLSSIGDGSFYFKSVLALGEASYLVLGEDAMGTKAYSYGYDAQAASMPQGELSVYALEDSVALQQAIALFQRQNTDIYVKKEIGLSGEDGVTAEDALRSLGTDIMAGDGPDVLILDGMPVDSYIEKGILADISPIVEEVMDDPGEGLFENIVEAYRRDGKIYEMPSHFFVPLIVGDEEALDACGSLNKLADYAERLAAENPDRHVLMPMTAEGLLNELFYMDSASWSLESGAPLEEDVREFLSCARRICDLNDYEGGAPNPDVTNYSISGGTLYGSLNFGETYRFSQGTLLSFGTAANLDNMMTLSAWERSAGGDYRLFGGEDASFVPYVSAGILAGQEENEAARGFVRLLLGKEYQSVSRDGFPVNRAAISDQQKVQRGYMMGFAGADGEMNVADVDALTEGQLDRLIGELGSISNVAKTDRVVQELVVGEGLRYLLGETDLDGAVSAIMQKVGLYEAE